MSLLFVVLSTLPTLAGTWWAVQSFRLSDPREKLAKAKFVGRMLGTGIAASMIFAALGIMSAVQAIGGESVDPSQKARILAEGIAAAMNCAAWGVLQGIYAVVLLFFLRRSLLDDDGPRDPSVTPRGKISGPYSPPGGDAPE